MIETTYRKSIINLWIPIQQKLLVSDKNVVVSKTYKRSHVIYIFFRSSLAKIQLSPSFEHYGIRLTGFS